MSINIILNTGNVVEWPMRYVRKKIDILFPLHFYWTRIVYRAY